MGVTSPDHIDAFFYSEVPDYGAPTDSGERVRCEERGPGTAVTPADKKRCYWRPAGAEGEVLDIGAAPKTRLVLIEAWWHVPEVRRHRARQPRTRV